MKMIMVMNKENTVAVGNEMAISWVLPEFMNVIKDYSEDCASITVGRVTWQHMYDSKDVVDGKRTCVLTRSFPPKRSKFSYIKAPGSVDEDTCILGGITTYNTFSTAVDTIIVMRLSNEQYGKKFNMPDVFTKKCTTFPQDLLVEEGQYYVETWSR